MSMKDDALFDEFLFDYDPTGELRKWLTEEQLQGEYRVWRDANRKAPEPDGAWTETGQQEQKRAKGARAIPLVIDCTFCGKALRLVFPFKAFLFRCPNCRGNYQIHSLDGPAPIFVVTPTRPHRSESRRPEQKMPEAVKTALRLLNLDQGATLSQVKSAFRKCMMEYHPDKVAHLGIELQKLAEAKTKEFVAAFTTIEAHLRSMETDAEPSVGGYRR